MFNKYYEKNPVLSLPNGLTTGDITLYYYLGGTLVALSKTLGLPEKKNGTLRYVVQDHLTGTSTTWDTAANPVAGIKYLPWGDRRNSTGIIDTERQFTGQRLDSSTGLYYYGARYYDPSIGRFISADTIVPGLSNSQSLNRYSYVLNNPVRYRDPTGRCIPLCLAVAALAVAPLVGNPHLADVAKAAIATAVVFGTAVAARAIAERGGSYGPKDFSPDVPKGIAELQIKASTPPTEINIWPSGPPPEFDPVSKAIVATAITTVVVTSVAGTLSEALERDGTAPREPGNNEPSMPVGTPNSPTSSEANIAASAVSQADFYTGSATHSYDYTYDYYSDYFDYTYDDYSNYYDYDYYDSYDWYEW